MVGFFIHSEHFRFRKGVPVPIQKFILIYIDNEYIKETLSFRIMEQMTEILNVANHSVPANNAVTDIIMASLAEHGLGLDLVLDFLKIIRMNHSLKGSSCQFQKLLK